MTELRTLERLSLSHKLRKQRSFGEGKADGRIKKPSGHNWKKIWFNNFFNCYLELLLAQWRHFVSIRNDGPQE